MNRIWTIIAQIICIPVHNIETKQKIRKVVVDFRSQAWINYIRFRKKHVHQNSILLIELNDCHGEVLGGTIPYLQKLGYNIDILMDRTVARQHPLCRQKMSGIHIYKFWPTTKNRFLYTDTIKQYNNIILMTSAHYHDRVGETYGGALKKLRDAGLDPIVIEHDLIDIDRFQEHDIMQRGRLMTLGKFKDCVFFNPHLFGRVKYTGKNHLTTFITVGGINPQRKNFQMLVTSIQELARMRTNFKVIIIGEGNIDNLPANIRPFIHLTGRYLKFPKMFTILENADFFLPLLDPECDAHNRYITTGVTGSAQLIYGFAKIPVIHTKFAKFYRFNNKNAVVYNNKLSDAMLQAIDMNAQQYSEIQQQLKDTTLIIADESMKNLRGILK